MTSVGGVRGATRLVVAMLAVSVAACRSTGADGGASSASDVRRMVHRTQVRVPGQDGVHTSRIPACAVTNDGTLLAVYDARWKHSGDLPADVDVVLQTSTDRGLTWSPMRRIIDFDASEPGSKGNGVGDPAILVDRVTGDILVVALWSFGDRGWNGSRPGLSKEETGQCVLVRSSDGGRSWSVPVSITPSVKDPSWHLFFQGPGNGITLRDGTLVFPAQWRGADRVAHSAFMWSTDRGATWRVSPPAHPGKAPTSESAIAEASDGSLVLSMRDETRSGRRLFARWRFDGDIAKGSWSPTWAPFEDPTCMASMIRLPNGRLLHANAADPKRRVRLALRESADDGSTWSQPWIVDSGKCAYSSLVAFDDGDVGVLFEHGLADSIGWMSFVLAR